MFAPIEPAPERNLAEYAARRKLKIQKCLGGGVQGVVYATDVSTAIKAFKYREHYRQEVEVYKRIKKRGITNVLGFKVPTPIRRNDKLMVLEMGIVRPPFVLDFASAGLDRPLYQHTPEALQEWEESRKEIFEERWAEVRRVISHFRSHGIFLSDVKPGNIMFVD